MQPVADAAAEGTGFFSRLTDSRPLLVVTGAGISSACGIPTYRDQHGVWLRSDPITHQQFINEPRQRQRYWGRSTLGWPAVAQARPSRAHAALAALEAAGRVLHVVTQNVDRLHQRAGSRQVTDLHGRLDRVRCLDCAACSDREAMQARLLAMNPWLDRPVSAARPDGDADLLEDEVERVRVPSCARCDGILMPDVVFFGGSIPRHRTQESERLLEKAAATLVIGSSLKVYSGFRLCRQTVAAGKPLLIINPGITRADPIADARLPLDADSALRGWLQAEGLGGPTHFDGGVTA